MTTSTVPTMPMIIPCKRPFPYYVDIIQLSRNWRKTFLAPSSQPILQWAERWHCVSMHKCRICGNVIVGRTHRRTWVALHDVQHVAYHFPTSNGWVARRWERPASSRRIRMFSASKDTLNTCTNTLNLLSMQRQYVRVSRIRLQENKYPLYASNKPCLRSAIVIVAAANTLAITAIIHATLF